MDEKLNKSIDALIDELFSENVEKSVQIAKDAKMTADEAMAQVPKAPNPGHPLKQISDVPQTDTDGARAKEYDSAISEKGKEDDQEESDQVAPPKNLKKSTELSEEEYAEFQAFKKSKEVAKVEELKKAEEDKIENLIKSVVEKTASKYEVKIDELSKSLNEQRELVKAMASQPQKSKAITNLQVLEKSTGNNGQSSRSESFTKSEILDAAEELVAKGQLSMDSVIELEQTGHLYNPNHRKLIEQHLNKRR